MNLAMNVLATFISSFLLGRKRGTNEKRCDQYKTAVACDFVYPLMSMVFMFSVVYIVILNSYFLQALLCDGIRKRRRSDVPNPT